MFRKMASTYEVAFDSHIIWPTIHLFLLTGNLARVSQTDCPEILEGHQNEHSKMQIRYNAPGLQAFGGSPLRERSSQNGGRLLRLITPPTASALPHAPSFPPGHQLSDTAVPTQTHLFIPPFLHSCCSLHLESPFPSTANNHLHLSSSAKPSWPAAPNSLLPPTGSQVERCLPHTRATPQSQLPQDRGGAWWVCVTFSPARSPAWRGILNACGTAV